MSRATLRGCFRALDGSGADVASLPTTTPLRSTGPPSATTSCSSPAIGGGAQGLARSRSRRGETGDRSAVRTKAPNGDGHYTRHRLDRGCQEPTSSLHGASEARKAAHSSKALFSGSRAGPRSAHSQTTSTRHPLSPSRLIAARSRERFASIFDNQNIGRVAGVLHIGHAWPCQKQPCTKTTARRPGKTRSGRPGRSLA